MALNLSGLPNVPMRILSIILFILTSWATVGLSWLGLSYVMSNYFVVILGLWAERDSAAPIPVQFFFFGMVFTLLNDIMSIGITYPGNDALYSYGYLQSTFRFNAAMCIILILIKPVACVFIYKEWRDRVAGGGQDNSNYERLGGHNSSSYNQGGLYSNEPPTYQPPQSKPFP